jgi:hypothetical protein
MEARIARKALLPLLGLTILLRVLFLDQAIQGDDHIYITEAQHALVDPLHPNNLKYVFVGDEVDLRGHSHPPGNAWPVAMLIAAFGEVKEVPFHAAYIVFSLIAVGAMWALACRYSPNPVWAVLLFIAVPAFQINGNSLEADLPFLAFWMASIALFCARRIWLCAAAMAAAAMFAYQAVFLIPILAVWVWLFAPKDRARRLLLAVPLVTIAAWQIFTHATTGTMPASQLLTYFSTYGFWAIVPVLKGSLMLLIHSLWIVFPGLVPFAAVRAWRRRAEPETHFLLAWIGLFLLCGFTIFFAGSARYLLPIAAPVCILVSRLQPRWLAVGFLAQISLGLALASVNYQHWEGYRTIAAALRPQMAGHRVFVDDNWGLRFYMEQAGALPLRKSQRLRPGDLIVWSDLGQSVEVTASTTLISKTAIEPNFPLRLLSLTSHSGYSTVSRGFWPFGFSTDPVDAVGAELVTERHADLEYVTVKSPDAAGQLVSGIDRNDGWIGKAAVIALKEPAEPKKLRAEVYVPPNAKARGVTLLLDGREVASRTVPGPGPYTIETAQPVSGGSLEIRVDQTFRVPGDKRDLGMVLIGAGYR